MKYQKFRWIKMIYLRGNLCQKAKYSTIPTHQIDCYGLLTMSQLALKYNVIYLPIYFYLLYSLKSIAHGMKSSEAIRCQILQFEYMLQRVTEQVNDFYI